MVSDKNRKRLHEKTTLLLARGGHGREHLVYVLRPSGEVRVYDEMFELGIGDRVIGVVHKEWGIVDKGEFIHKWIDRTLDSCETDTESLG